MVDTTSTSPRFRVWLFGSFAVERKKADGTWEPVPADAWGPNTYASNLFKYLLCHDRKALRGTLMEVLWARSDLLLTDKYLSNAAYFLRKALQDEQLLKTTSNRSRYELADQCLVWSDIEACDHLLKEVQRIGPVQGVHLLEEAAGYFGRGRLLEGDGAEWCVWRRGQLDTLCYRSRLWLADAYEEQGDYYKAEVQVEQLLKHDPRDDAALARLMGLLHKQGLTAEALRRYKDTKLLYQHLALPFPAELDTLAEGIQHGSRVVKNLRSSIETTLPASILSSQEHVPLDLPPQFSPTATQNLIGKDNYEQDIMKVVRELEGTTDVKVSDITHRRAVLAHLFNIPVAALAADSHIVDTIADAMKLQEEMLSLLYEDMLIMGWDSFRRSKSPHIITKIDEHVNKLDVLSRSASIRDIAHWQSLLCRFSQLSTRIAQHRLDEPRALRIAKQAIMIAIDLDDPELIASTFYQRHIVHMEHSNTALSETKKLKHIMQAKADIDAALGYVERVRVPLAGNIYLTAAEVYSRFAGDDASLQTQCEKWQDKVAVFIAQGNIEDDGSFLKLDVAALYHERAKTLLRFGKLEEAERDLNNAWKTLQPNLFTWHMNIHLTQAALFIAQHNIKESAQSSLKAYTLAKTIHSHKGEVEVQRLLEQLQQLDKMNSAVRELTMTVGGNA